MNAAQLIHQNSSDVEYYTPKDIIEAARATMGGIDLDPASSAKANERVMAKHWLSSGGIEAGWWGRVWLNHPFGRKEDSCSNPGQNCPRRKKSSTHVCHAYDLHGNEAWINKLVTAYHHGQIFQACSITFAATSEKWFQPLLLYPQCFLSPRTNYLLPDGTVKRGVTKGSVVTYLGERVPAFIENFRKFGVIKVLPERSSIPERIIRSRSMKPYTGIQQRS